GTTSDQSRMVRAREVMESWFRRIPMNEYRVSILATYTKALPVVEDTRDIAVVENVLNDLPMHFAFQAGETNLFSGLEAAAEMARGWRPRSTTIVLVSDGDTVPATGMPAMPAAVA
ncbi:MAG: VWA domain-containing protein, partial [Planctomyces sp.]